MKLVCLLVQYRAGDVLVAVTHSRCVVELRRRQRVRTTFNKKLSCRREVARRFVSLNISLSHSRLLFEMTPVSTTLCKYVYLVPFLRYRRSNNGVTLKSGLGVIQSHWKPRHHSIARIRVPVGVPCNYSPIISEINRDWSKIVSFHTNCIRRQLLEVHVRILTLGLVLKNYNGVL